MGYAGGKTKDPTYQNIGDHAEAIQVDYDPARISYEELLNIFWNGHDSLHRAWSRQYMSAVFYHGEVQRTAALETKARWEEKKRKKSLTEIVAFTTFYTAEDYHQKYQLRQQRLLMDEFKTIYPRPFDFVNSTAAARVNGYVGGHGTMGEIRSNLDSLGLSIHGQQRLLEIVRRYQK